MLKEEKIYVLKNKSLKAEIIQLHHNVLVVEYKDRWKMIELVTRKYWWLGIMRDIGRYVEGYDMCQRMKNRTEKIAGKLKLSEVLEKL